MSQPLIRALQNPAIYTHPAGDFQVIETHISWVLLTGAYAYKIKKPVDFGFLDFTRLEDRKHFCEEELRLNQRMTDGLYLRVIPITGSPEAPQFDGDGPVIEYALQMRQFSQEDMLDAVQRRGELTLAQIDELARLIGHFHQNTEQVAAGHAQGSPEAVMAPVRQNFEQIRPLLRERADLDQLQALESWAETTYERLLPDLQTRKQQGFVRECHGDIHLANITLIDNRLVVFDCIEFNEPFRMIDIASDIAFLLMDLEDRGLKSFARRFLNTWLETTGDYAALPLLNFYKAYRAMVRGKVSLLRLAQEQDPVQRAVILRQYRSYAALAERYSAIPSRFLAITHGVSAVGKSHVALRLVDALGAICLRSDIERKRLLGEQPAALKDQLKTGIYSEQASQQIYNHLQQLALTVLQAGHSVIIDATHLKHAQRQAAWQIAESTGVPFLILDCHAPEAVIAGWLQQRQQANTDPSDATLAVIQAQQAGREALDSDEQRYSTRIDTHDPDSTDSLIERIRQKLPGF